MSAEIETLKQQMLELQSQFAFQEDALRSLDLALSGQQQEILVLRRHLELLRQRQQEHAAQSEAALPGMPADERPPHY